MLAGIVVLAILIAVAVRGFRRRYNGSSQPYRARRSSRSKDWYAGVSFPIFGWLWGRIGRRF
jgi:hypothetical protein